MKNKTFNPSYIGIRLDLINLINGDSLSILDVGCANGANGKFLKDKKIADTVYGIEYDSEMAEISKTYYDNVLIGDLNSAEFLNKIIDIKLKFDYIIFGDILEHLIDSELVLKTISTNLLKDNGQVIISLPNIAHIELFIQVYIKGTWPRNSRGIFDKTHLTWFTKKDAIKIVENSNLKLIKYYSNSRSRDAIGSKFTFFYRLLKLINKNWFTFQHIMICNKN